MKMRWRGLSGSTATPPLVPLTLTSCSCVLDEHHLPQMWKGQSGKDWGLGWVWGVIGGGREHIGSMEVWEM